MPLYEVTMFPTRRPPCCDHLRFGEGHRTKSSCRADGDMYVCIADYEFRPHSRPAPRGMHAVPGDCPEPHPPADRRARRESGSGCFRSDPAGGRRSFPSTLSHRNSLARPDQRRMEIAYLCCRSLVLAGIAVAARSGKEAFGMVAALVVAEWVSPTFAAKIPATLSPRFLESAVTLALAYLWWRFYFCPTGPDVGSQWLRRVRLRGFRSRGFPRII